MTVDDDDDTDDEDAVLVVSYDGGDHLAVNMLYV